MGSRDIGCSKVADPRGRQICGSVSQSLEWTWLGHAIVSPGWRLTWAGLRRVYCREKVSSADAPALASMSRAADWRLQSAAEDLLRLVDAAAGRSKEAENSIFNPANPSYLLKDGCNPDRR